ncbi:unnamed protein product, partial [Closterium sp. Yama58-4]
FVIASVFIGVYTLGHHQAHCAHLPGFRLQPFSVYSGWACHTHQKRDLGLSSNYLTGTIPPLPASLLSLDVAFNFLSGSFPQLSLSYCTANQNCFLNSSNCCTYSSLQRPTTACAICGTTDGQGALCGSGLCAPRSSVYAGNGTINVPSLPPVSMACQGNAPLVLMNAASVSAMLSIKSYFGLTYTDWTASTLCVVGTSPVQSGITSTWTRVDCSADGSPATA